MRRHFLKLKLTLIATEWRQLFSNYISCVAIYRQRYHTDVEMAGSAVVHEYIHTTHALSP
jgi:hypothetical protein